jgi:hypothetical protein
MRKSHILGRSGFAVALALIAVLVLVFAGRPVGAQSSFSSGSTSADGAFAPTTSQSIQVPASGVFNYTTVNIPAGVAITYTPNATNTPVTILASGDVTIAGLLILDGQKGTAAGAGGAGGPGGFGGGNGAVGIGTQSGTNGDGPGAGFGGSVSASTAAPGGGAGHAISGNTPNVAGSGSGGPAYGAAVLLPLIGGSGGGGGAATATFSGAGGGGGGGAILIASSTTITVSGGIYARGNVDGGGFGGAAGGSGSGGAIRLVANTLAGSGTLDVTCLGNSVQNFQGSNAGSIGYVRAEGYTTGAFTPSVPSGGMSLSTPNPVSIPSGGPSLVIASVGGVSAPSAPLGSLSGPPDIVLPATQPNPVTVNLQGSGIPLGTSAQLTITPLVGPAGAPVSSTAFGGAIGSSAAQASVTLPAGMSVITAAITVNLSNLADNRLPTHINGEPIDKVEIAATFGGKSRLTYITRSGKRIPAE